MAGRTRTTKKLAQRIDLNYFKRLYPIPRMRRILSVGLTALALLWLAWGRQQSFNAGPLSHPHAILTDKCTSCHAVETKFGQKVTDQACSQCHDGPLHNVKQAFTPACMDCHVEHQGSFRLASTRDQSCTQCHHLGSFNSGHPEFAARSDPGTIKFGHQVHLKKDLRGPHGLVELKCSDCHTREEADMAPIDYQKHCAECHPLSFDRRFPESAPHKKPEVVVAFVVQKFTRYIAVHPEEVHMADPADPRTLRPPQPPARNATEWIARRVADTEQLLWRKSCKECHTLGAATLYTPYSMSESELPEVPKAAINTRWMMKASFEHEAHQMLVCTECHARAPNSQDTSDVLLPGIQTCQRCHQAGAKSADAHCSECHVYHDWTKEKKVEGKFLITDQKGDRRLFRPEH